MMSLQRSLTPIFLTFSSLYCWHSLWASRSLFTIAVCFPVERATWKPTDGGQELRRNWNLVQQPTQKWILPTDTWVILEANPSQLSFEMTVAPWETQLSWIPDPRDLWNKKNLVFYQLIGLGATYYAAIDNWHGMTSRSLSLFFESPCTQKAHIFILWWNKRFQLHLLNPASSYPHTCFFFFFFFQKHAPLPSSFLFPKAQMNGMRNVIPAIWIQNTGVIVNFPILCTDKSTHSLNASTLISFLHKDPSIHSSLPDYCFLMS